MAPRNSSSQSVTRATFDWSVINEELFSLMSPVKEALNCDAISTDEAASAFPDLIGAHPHNSDRIFNSHTSLLRDVVDLMNS